MFYQNNLVSVFQRKRDWKRVPVSYKYLIGRFNPAGVTYSLERYRDEFTSVHWLKKQRRYRGKVA